MKLLLDTHALIWFLENDPILSEQVKLAIEAKETTRFVSYASAWEMAIKIALGKLRSPIPFEDLMPGCLESLGFELLPLRPMHLHLLLQLPLHHRDPFDRLMIAQAQAEGLIIATRDSQFAAYGVPILW